MKTIEISIDGQKLPMRATMGAMKQFKKLTGRDSKDMDQNSPEDVTTFIYCCICSACRKDGKDFKMSLDEFLDSVDVDTINGWSAELSEASRAASGDEQNQHDDMAEALPNPQQGRAEAKP